MVAFTFQSAPPTEARGDLHTLPPSPPRLVFQSAPPTEARGDRRRPESLRLLPRFNPLPLPKQGEIQEAAARPGRFSVSIRSPYRSKGRCELSRLLDGRSQRFNPLPLPKQGEILVVLQPRHHCGGFNPLPLPKQGEMGQSNEERVASFVSIRSPYRSKGRYISKMACRDGLYGFNPLPLPKQGEMASSSKA